ncbi:TPA: hypothetical protein ACGO11_001206 [Streptococcus suis]
MERKIVILTKSEKHNAYCVAGRDIETDEWVRLVNRDEVMTDENLTTQEGYICKELDVVVVDCFDQPSNIEHQPENVYIKEGYFISKVGEMTWEEVVKRWGCDIKNTILGIPRDKQAVRLQNRLEFYKNYEVSQKSLALIKVENVSFKTNLDTNGGYRRHPKVKFSYLNNSNQTLEYCITLTEDSYRYPNNETIDDLCFDSAYIIVSVGEEYNDYVYLLAAKIILI